MVIDAYRHPLGGCEILARDSQCLGRNVPQTRFGPLARQIWGTVGDPRSIDDNSEMSTAVDEHSHRKSIAASLARIRSLYLKLFTSRLPPLCVIGLDLEYRPEPTTRDSQRGSRIAVHQGTINCIPGQVAGPNPIVLSRDLQHGDHVHCADCASSSS